MIKSSLFRSSRVVLRRVVTLAALVWLLSCLALAQTTSTLTGTITDSSGNPLNGTLIMRLPVPAQYTPTNKAVAPTPVTYNVLNGAIQGGSILPLYDVNALQPANLFYIARAYDQTGALQFYGNFVVTGATFNLGAATPTSVTTSNISYLTPASLSGNNTWTGINTWSNSSIFNGPVTFNGLVNGGQFGSTISLSNQSPTGTTLDTLTITTGAPSTGIIAPISTTNGILGICVSGCAASGTGVIQQTGVAPCVFDGGTTANDYVVASSTTLGNCHDSGVAPPSKPTSTAEVIGQVLSTNVGAGTYNVAMTLQAPIPSTFGAISVTSLSCTLVTKTAIYTLTTNDCIVQASVSGGSFTLTLPHTATGQLWTITRTDNSANNLTIAGDSGNVNGQASIQVPANHTTFCHADGSNSWCTDQNTRDFSVGGCTPASSTDAQCTGTITISPPFADASYIPVLTANGNGGSVPNLTVTVNGSLSSSSIPYAISCTFSCGTVNAPTIYVHAWHP